MKLDYFWIAVGSALGGVARYWMSGAVAQRFGEAFPAGTLLVNVLGSLLIGFIGLLGDPSGHYVIPPMARRFLMVGVLGGFTTFSSFSFQTLQLIQDGEWLWASANVVLSVALCLLGVWLGALGAQALNR